MNASAQSVLMGGYQAHDPKTGRPVFAFRLHQFISRGDTAYASLEDPAVRHITLNGQKFVPNDRDKILLPLAFCRECGQEYYVIRRFTDKKTDNMVVVPRGLTDQAREEDNENGFLYANRENPWSDDQDELIDNERLPEDWLEQISSEEYRVKRDQRKKLPQPIRVNPLGEADAQGELYHFVQSPLPFCLNCGAAYGNRERSDFAKLSGLSSEGRSTATTILTLSAYRSLKHDTVLEQKAKKLLSFTDNRQDASLQAGHFNDFVEVGLLRAALYRAVVEAGPKGLAYDELALRVFERLNLPFELYASNTDSLNRKTRRQTDEALRQILAYRLYIDLRRGWRLTAPNLEQCGLLKIAYPDLQDVAEDDEVWQDCHPALADATSETRYQVCKTLLDLLRRELAIRVDVLEPTYQERIRTNSNQHLLEPWAIDQETELRMTPSRVALPGPRRLRDNSGEYVAVSNRSRFGAYLRRQSTLPDYSGNLNLTETEKLIAALFDVLTKAGLIEIIEEAKDTADVAGYQIPADVMIWQAGDGAKPFHDPIRIRRQSTAAVKTNQFFVYFYKEVAIELQGLQAREHTAQVPSDERQKREDEFREATLPVLFCSPTMELGVDISQLNVVNMRNVPPTPANYAQRSGRAGRSGQPALVFTYCTSGSPHDQYFYKRPSLMVHGAVKPPRLDLANEDLVRSHVHAVWLAETGQSLHSSLADLISLEGDPPALALKDSVMKELERTLPRQAAHRRMTEIFAGMHDELQDATWFTTDWLDKVLNQTMHRFDEACARWRSLYLSALHQQKTQNEIVMDNSRVKSDRDQATRLRGEAEKQIQLLTDSSNVVQSDFYSYRYFASEGFLPGYNFPRLPLSAFIPARRGNQRRDQTEYLSRPRFLAISEFGPRSIIYHEGSRYLINKVILPVGDPNSNAGSTLSTGTAKVCPQCGYLHPLANGVDNLEYCEFCQARLAIPLRSLFRMQNVSTQRRDRINSDEEERVRMGYELQTSVRFEERDGRPSFATAHVKSADGHDLLTLTYGDTATLWRINKGWRRRKDKQDLGFVLDVERGYWAKNEQEIESDKDDELSARREKVIPYVEDRRNSLLIEFTERYSNEVMASLQPALKSAIQIIYQLEDSELAAEPLPSRDERNMLLIYESAEGGAGVLRQMVTDEEAIKQVARQALELCHFDPDTREDKRRAPTAKEDCEAACYDCLMSYFNQMDHQLLDRKLVLTPLYELANATVDITPTRLARGDYLTQLKAQCDSDLEREWLDFLNARNLRLPDSAQRLIEQCNTRCDFYYHDKAVVIYVDGAPHDHSDVAAADREITDCLQLDLGLTVLRFRYDEREQWERIVKNHDYLFGKVHA